MHGSSPYGAGMDGGTHHRADDGHRRAGTVRWFSPEKGYGFIQADGDDVFVRHSAIRMDGFRTLDPGASVSFSVTRDGRGPVAVDVTLERAARSGRL